MHRSTTSVAQSVENIEIVFYKQILDHRGFPHRCELMRIPKKAANVDGAIADAILEFETSQQVNDWSIAADCYDVQQRCAVY
ncbi:hypothetical protein F4827_006779 [Paraburkholderia bannensis]|uniref:Uncharacterized protein n=1 Tax=Paraburkholderia bannensis TaxID=765414 RepID=A0A7W9U6J2_9BURK|nr:MULTISPECIES: hypothetical protein [Paraburkholderia]MBB3261905.1 hypothetical protein [Paraburkholderia sp. WP4_3_2]MBB6106900.1 hypothetical protein [Paraburkholderia bannensis]